MWTALSWLYYFEFPAAARMLLVYGAFRVLQQHIYRTAHIASPQSHCVQFCQVAGLPVIFQRWVYLVVYFFYNFFLFGGSGVIAVDE